LYPCGNIGGQRVKLFQNRPLQALKKFITLSNLQLHDYFQLTEQAADNKASKKAVLSKANA